MAKNYKETTTQAAVLRTSTKTLSFWCNIREAPLERFAELIEGNIRIALQDFSGGKGDKSKFAYFNLEISDIYEIKDCMQAKKSFFAQKIYGKHPETGGQFNGMCKSFHFALQYTEKAQNGELSRNPYYLCIKNGFAQAAPGQIAGSFYERKGTFQEGVAVFIRLSERDLKNLLRKVTDYIRVFQMLAGQHLIPLGLAQMENEYSQRKNGYNYNDSYTNPTDYKCYGICWNCGRPFTQSRTDQLFCSAKCRNKYRYTPVPRCKNCTAPDCAIRDEQRAYAPKACPERNH